MPHPFATWTIIIIYYNRSNRFSAHVNFIFSLESIHRIIYEPVGAGGIQVMHTYGIKYIRVSCGGTLARVYYNNNITHMCCI